MSDSPVPKRRRIVRSPSPPVYKLDDEDDTYEPYIPVTQRKQAKLAKLSALGASSEDPQRIAARREQEIRDEAEDAEREAERAKEKARKERTLLAEAQAVHAKKIEEGVWYLLNIIL